MSAFQGEEPPLDDMAAGVPQEDPQLPLAPPVEPGEAEERALAVDAREELGLSLVQAADKCADGAAIAAGLQEAETAERFAQATHKLVQAIVLLVPVTSADDLVEGAGLTTNRERTDQ